MYLLRQLKERVPQETILSAYFALFQSILCYGIMVWGHSSIHHRLFSLQRRAVRVIANLKYRDYCQNAFRKLQILTFPSLFILQCLNYIKTNINTYRTHREVHLYNTRNNDNIYPEYVRLTRTQSDNRYLGIRFYNALPDYVKYLPPSKFKSKIKIFLTNRALYSIEEFWNCDFGKI